MDLGGGLGRVNPSGRTGTGITAPKVAWIRSLFPCGLYTAQAAERAGSTQIGTGRRSPTDDTEAPAGLAARGGGAAAGPGPGEAWVAAMTGAADYTTLWSKV